jgi:hypothetical protein
MKINYEKKNSIVYKRQRFHAYNDCIVHTTFVYLRDLYQITQTFMPFFSY